jgi:uncharacterized damage-inducible protein DinB
MATAGALATVLDDLAEVVLALSDGQYADSGLPGVSGTIGGHVRHVLDHVSAFERGAESGMVDYDSRERRTLVEFDRTLAASQLMMAVRRIARIDNDTLGKSVIVRTRLRDDHPPIYVMSSVGRELSFVVAHTIHHSATIAVLARMDAERLPARFGIAPSTPVDSVRTSCAR